MCENPRLFFQKNPEDQDEDYYDEWGDDIRDFEMKQERLNQREGDKWL